ncbi:MAG: hypothetical protein JNL32_07310 [Candidatus Kapabacteria bacterium]|nr:hypothetical protein [Candidatus Kapabacteria bacterium]
MKTLYALIWKAREDDSTFKNEEFEKRVPRLMNWLRALHAGGHLVACGGGGLEQHSGGLTIITADSPEQALELGAGSPMNEIGTTELLVWDVFYSNLTVLENISRLE